MTIRGVDPATALAIDALRGETLPFWGAYGPVVEVTFPVASTRRDIAHGLSQVPDGYFIVWADGTLFAEPGVLWTKDLAYMRSGADNVHARIIFYTVREAYREA